MAQEEPKREWHNAVKVEVSEVEIELTGKNNEQVDRLRLVTDIGDITYRPRKKSVSRGTLAGFKTSVKNKELFTMSEFVLEFPLIKELNNQTLKKPQELWLSYAQITNTYENENEDTGETESEEVSYRYMVDNQVEDIYYEFVHKKDKANLEKQKKIQAKFSGKEL